MSTVAVHNTAQNYSSDNLPSYPSDNHHSSDNCLLEEMGLGRKARFPLPELTARVNGPS